MSDRQVYAAPNPAAARDTIPPPPRATNRTLWLAVFVPPLAWSVDELTSIAVHQDYCAAVLGRTFRPWSGIGVILTVLGLVMLALSLTAGAAAWRAHVAVGSDDGTGDTDVDRRRFMARGAMLLCALFSYAIVLRTIAVFIVPAGICGQ